jgi:hypothetical protein
MLACRRIAAGILDVWFRDRRRRGARRVMKRGHHCDGIAWRSPAEDVDPVGMEESALRVAKFKVIRKFLSGSEGNGARLRALGRDATGDTGLRRKKSVIRQSTGSIRNRTANRVETRERHKITAADTVDDPTVKRPDYRAAKENSKLLHHVLTDSMAG